MKERQPLNAIEVVSLSKAFGSKKALDNVSFTVQSGSILGFLGPNGAGKTTTIRCLMDFIKPTRGMVTILDQDAHQASTELKKHIGFLSSDQQLNLNWTGREHIRLATSIKGRSKTVGQLIKLLDFDPKLKVKALSSGNKQKLSIILAFVGNPQLLIMDEPTRGLDPVLQKVLSELLRDFVHEGGTVFFSSHNLGEVQGLCDSVVFIREGRVITEKSMFDIRAMNVHIISAASTEPFDTSKLRAAGAKIERSRGNEVTLKIKGDFNPILRVLTANPLTDLDVTHANLEDIFLEEYKGQ